jgi:hypothetical protein
MELHNRYRWRSVLRGVLLGIGIVIITALISPLFFEIEKVLDSWTEHKLYDGLWLVSRPLSYTFFFLQTALLYGVPSGVGGGVLGWVAVYGGRRQIALWSLLVGILVPLSGAILLALVAFILSGQPHLDKSMLIMHFLVMAPLFGFAGQKLVKIFGNKDR